MIGTILGILGILITLAFGAYSIWTYKKSKKDISLEFQSKECYSLFRDDVNRLNIELIYKKQTLTNTLILLKAKLVNNGHTDIDKNRIFSPLKIITTNKYKWLESTITFHPEGATTNVELLNENEIQLNWDLLKQSEYIEIEALAEIKNSEKSDGEKGIQFYNSLTFDYRITDLNSIQKEKLISNIFRIRNIFEKTRFITGISAIVIGLIFLSVGFFPTLNFIDKQFVEYTLKIDDSEIIAYLFSEDPEIIKLKIDGKDKPVILTVDEFNKIYKINSVKRLSIDPTSSKFNRIIGIVYLFMGSVILLLKRRKKRNKPIHSSAPAPNFV